MATQDELDKIYLCEEYDRFSKGWVPVGFLLYLDAALAWKTKDPRKFRRITIVSRGVQ